MAPLCAVFDCGGTSTHELLTPAGEPFYEHDEAGVFICASHATDFETDHMKARPVTFTEDGGVTR